MREEFADWMTLEGRKKDGTKRPTQMQDIRKINRVFGDLDKHYEIDGLQSVVAKLTYSNEDVENRREYYSEMKFKPQVPKSDPGHFRRLKRNFDNARSLVERYRRFCAATVGEIPEIAAEADTFDPKNNTDDREKIPQPIFVRRGQEQFRKALCLAYCNACAISGCDVLDVLEAAHITPYLGRHTNHVTNGLLLRADLHILFDCGLISVDPDSFAVLVKPWLRDSVYWDFNSKPLRAALQNDLAPSREALRLHRAEVYDVRTR